MNRKKIDQELSKINAKYYLEEELAPVFYKKVQTILNEFREKAHPIVKLRNWFKSMKLLFNLLLFTYFVTLFFYWNDFHFFFIINTLLVLLFFFVKIISYNDNETAQEIDLIYKPTFSKFFVESTTAATGLLLWNNTIFFAISTGSFFLGFFLILISLVYSILVISVWFSTTDKPRLRGNIFDGFFFFVVIGVLMTVLYPIIYSANDINNESLDVIYLFYMLFGNWAIFTFFIWRLYLKKGDTRKSKKSKIKIKKINSLFNTLLGTTILSVNEITDEIKGLKLKLEEQKNNLRTTQEELDLKINDFFSSDLKIQSDACALNFDNLKHHLPKRAVLVCEELIVIYSQKQKNIKYNIELFQEIINQRERERQIRLQIISELENIEEKINKEKEDLQRNKKEDQRIDNLIIGLKDELSEFDDDNTKNLENIIYLVENEQTQSSKFEKSYEFRRQQKKLDKKLEQAKNQSEFYKLKMNVYNELIEKYKTEESINDFSEELKTLISDFKNGVKK